MARSRPAPSAKPGTETVAARVVLSTLAFAESEGLSRKMLVEAAGLTDVDLTDLESRVPLSRQLALWQLLQKALPDPGTGVRIGAWVPLRDRGLLGYVMYYSPTLGVALQRLQRFLRVNTEAYRVTVETRGQQVVVRHHDAAPAVIPFAIDNRLAAILNACREITRVDVVPLEVAFEYPQPVSILEHKRFFRCPLKFGQPVSQLVLAARDMDLPVPLADETLARYVSGHAEKVLESLVAGTSVTGQVRSAIWAVLSEGRPTLPRIAAAVRMPARTLQRRLAEEGTSLHAEVEHIRKSMATATLRDHNVPIEEVAFVLGYAEPSTFYRSFKRWTGKTPHQYRVAAA